MKRTTIFLRRSLLLVALAIAPGLASPTPEQVKDVARDLVCLCGTCNRESLSTCLCGTATSERETISTMLEAGQSRQQIVDSFVDRYGPMTLAQPPAGYDVVWIVPFFMLIAGVFGVRQVLVYWRRNRHSDAAPTGASAPTPSAPTAAKSGAYDDRLRADLDDFES